MRRAAFLLAVLAALAPAAARPPTDWRRIIVDHDNDRLRNWRPRFVQALAQARADGAGARIDAEGALLRPDTFLGTPRPPDGSYRCRLFVLGRKTALFQAFPDAHAFLVQPAARCEVRGPVFAMREGAERPSGQLYDYDGARLVLLGGMAIGDEAGRERYGRDPDRDLVGLLERYGERRWRLLLLPESGWQGQVDVVEIVPD